MECFPESLRPASQQWETFKAHLRRQARRLGLAALGILQARPLPRLRQELQRRLAEGSYPAFCERDPALRTDPRRWLAGARSLWVAAWPYQPPVPCDPPGPPRPFGRMAAYAVCPDYHVGLRRRLEALVCWAARRTGRDPARDFRIMVDTGPAVERELLRLSGLGFIGKNTCAFVPGAGSWVVLGVVVSTLPLPPDPGAAGPGAADPDAPFPPADACAGCTRCIDACPTGALSPYRLDPTRCISQLTQLRGILDEGQRLALGPWLFGCDVCQLVCPHNTPDQAPLAYRSPGRLRPAPGLGTRVSLLELLNMDGRAFAERLGPTAAAWRGRNVLQRNAACVAARALARTAAHAGRDSPDPTEADRRSSPPADAAAGPRPDAAPGPPALAAALERLAQSHPSPAVREVCRWALSCHRRPLRRLRNPCRTRPSGGPSPPGAASPDR